MPIKGLTKESEIGSGLPLIARLYKGDKKVGNRPGADLDYFRVEFEPQFTDLKEVWEELYGDKPDGFERVFMTYATVDEAFQSWKEEWTATTMLHRCDGEHQVVWYSHQAQAYSTAKEKCAATAPTPCQCDNIGRLNLLIPEFIQVTGVLGYVLVQTHSINDILTVYRTLADIQRINGTLLGVPFSLGRATRKISAPKTERNGTVSGRINVNKSLFYLYPDPDFTKEVLLPRLASTGGFFSAQQQNPALPAPSGQIDTSTARKLLGSGAERRLGAIPETPQQAGNEVPFELPPHPAPEMAAELPAPAIDSQAPRTSPPPPAPKKLPFDILREGLEEFEVEVYAAAKVLDIKNVDNLDEWRVHGTTPKLIAEKVKTLQSKKPAPVKPNPFGSSVKFDPQSQALFDELPGLNDENAPPVTTTALQGELTF